MESMLSRIQRATLLTSKAPKCILVPLWVEWSDALQAEAEPDWLSQAAIERER